MPHEMLIVSPYIISYGGSDVTKTSYKSLGKFNYLYGDSLY